MRVKASYFADAADLQAYKNAKSQGESEKEALSKGDNGIGCWGDNTAQDAVAMAAIPPEDMVSTFGSVIKAKHGVIYITAVGMDHINRTVKTLIADIMPPLKMALKQNGCRIDLNPAVVKQLHLPKGGGVLVDWTTVAPQ